MTPFSANHNSSLFIQIVLTVILISITRYLPLRGQNISYTDSLKIELQQIKIDTLRVPVLRKLIWHFLAFSPQESAPYLTELETIAQTGDHPFLRAITHNYYGIKYRHEGKFPEAINHFNQALEFYRTDPKYEAASTGPLFNLAVINQNIGSYGEALKMNFKILEIHENLKNTAMISQTYNAIGNNYKDLAEYSKAILYFDSAYVQAKRNNHIAETSLSVQSKANVLLETGRFEESIPLSLEALELNRNLNFQPGIASNYEALANAHAEMMNFNLALQYALEAMAINNSLLLTRALTVNEIVVADIYDRMGRTDLARHYAGKASDRSREMGDIESQLLAEDKLADIHEKQQRFELANEARKRAASLRDSLFHRDKLEIAQNYETRYEVEKKEKALENLALQNKIAGLELQRQKKLRTVLIVGIILLIFSVVLIARILQLRIAAQKLRRENEKVVYSNKIAHMEFERKTVAINSMLNGQEKERSRIAKDLHDGLGSLLATIKYQLETIIDHTVRQDQENPLHHTGALIDTACDEVRRIAHNMMPQALKEFGLIAAIKDLATNVEQTGIEVHVESLDEARIRLPLNEENILYRIVQELLQNCIKHARASKIIIQLATYKQQMILTIEDDGVGFTPDSSTLGMGLQNIKTRIGVLKGAFEIDAQPGVGSTFTITVPLSNHAHL
ncbi:MAG: sensor histidine kinase [Saprospiraceae bacterium]|nr:sensor histidine kinase [Saprospiraceae bacterium]